MKFNAQEQIIENYMTVEEYIDTLSPSERRYHNYTTPSLTDKPLPLILAQAKINPDFLNGNCIGKTINCIGYSTDYLMMPSGPVLRCILIDDEMQTYSTISAGIAKIVKTWINTGITPSQTEPIKVTYEQVRKGINTYYTLRVVF